jgi:hypothetical protein
VERPVHFQQKPPLQFQHPFFPARLQDNLSFVVADSVMDVGVAVADCYSVVVAAELLSSIQDRRCSKA